MTIRDLAKNRNTPAWLSAVVALVVGLVAVWSFASAPSGKTLDDHEQRIRVLEQLTAQQLASIDARLEAMAGELKRLRD